MELVEMNEQYAKEICAWTYENEYKIYEMPSWQEMIDDDWALTDNQKRKDNYNAFIEDKIGLVAFTSTYFMSDGIMIGVGVHPQYLSSGYGSKAIEMTVAYLRAEDPNCRLYLDVRTFNARAIRSYEKAGFKIIDKIEKVTHIGKGIFYRMEYTK